MTARLLRLAIWLATAIFVVLLILPLVQELLRRLSPAVDATSPPP